MNKGITEKVLEKNLIRRVNKLGGLALKYHNSFDTAFPDRLVLLPGGKTWWVELKSPLKKPTKLQKLKINKLRALGFKVSVVDSLKSLDELTRQLENLN